MNRNRIICFRIDEELDRRIRRTLGPRYYTRSSLIRIAIERLLLHEEAQGKLRDLQMSIQWG
jgi:Arc/MetJ-type ribon-helix-helix transcriptional regulator